MALTPGTKVGSYEIVMRIGAGGMVAVAGDGPGGLILVLNWTEELERLTSAN